MKNLTRARNSEFIRRCIQIYQRDLKSGITPVLDDIVDRAIAMQPHSHYVAFDSASKRLHAINKRGMENVVNSPLAQQMWSEIAAQVQQTMDSRNCKSFDRALSFVLNFCRPSRFYITRDTARRIALPYFITTVTLRKEVSDRV